MVRLGSRAAADGIANAASGARRGRWTTRAGWAVMSSEHVLMDAGRVRGEGAMSGGETRADEGWGDLGFEDRETDDDDARVSLFSRAQCRPFHEEGLV